MAELKTAKAPVSRKDAQRLNKLVRFGVQIVFLLLAPQAFSGAFSGAKSVLVAVGAGDVADITSFVILLLALCLYTVVFGRFFCGYACAFGLLGDALYAVGDLVAQKLGRKRKPLSEAFENKLRLLKYLVLVLILVLALAGASTIVSTVSPWTAFGRLANLQPDQVNVIGGILLLLLAVGMVVKERFFCEFLCPLGAIFSLLPILPWANLHRDMQVCNGCGTCKRNCPVGIYPPGEGKQMGECIQCGRCQDVCPKACINRVGKQPLSGLARIAALALILLATLWACGAVDYLPTPPWL